MEQNKKAKLSKSVMDMKFMKKTKDRVQKEEEDAEGQAMYCRSITADMRKNGSIIFIDTSLMQCKDLIEGRLSFGGMNPDLERFILNSHASKIEENEKKKEKEVTDVEMAKSFSTLVDTMANKFHPKAKKNRHSNRKFIKPKPLE